MDIRKLQRAIVDGLEDVKAQDIMVFNTEHLSPLFERVIVASGTSNRQTKALAASVRDAVKAKGFAVMRTEGEDNGEWIIVDCGAAVVHVMQPAIRTYYHLEEIWGEKPVKLKLGEAKTRLVKASEPDAATPAAAPRPRRSGSAAEALDKPARKVAAKKAAAPASAKTVAAKKVAAKTVGTGVAAKKRSVRRAEPVPVVVKVVGKPPAKKAAAKTAARPAAAKKAAAPRRTAAAAETPARKAPARKTAASPGTRKPRA